ncbi:MAG: hypothetical protein SFU98_07080 [Leptospiraceae bacterium]|nr:hypothetical protein [Leptospiraceae bacterium]
MNYSNIRINLFLIIFFMLTAISAETFQEKGKNLCKSDVMEHCKTYIFSGNEKVRDCLFEKKEVLNPACKEFIVTAQKFKKQMKENCGKDIQKFCSSNEGKPKEMKVCLKQNLSQFESTCQSFIKENSDRID